METGIWDRLEQRTGLLFHTLAFLTLPCKQNTFTTNPQAWTSLVCFSVEILSISPSVNDVPFNGQLNCSLYSCHPHPHPHASTATVSEVNSSYVERTHVEVKRCSPEPVQLRSKLASATGTLLSPPALCYSVFLSVKWGQSWYPHHRVTVRSERVMLVGWWEQHT